MPTKEPIVQKIADWAESKWPQIKVINLVNGGWEGWAQVELYFYLQNNPIPGQNDVSREVHCYDNTKLSVDFEIRCTKEDGKQKRIFIELKCETDTDQRRQEKGGEAVTFIQRVINEFATTEGTELNDMMNNFPSRLPGIPLPEPPVAAIDMGEIDYDYWVIGISASEGVSRGTQKALEVGGRYQSVTSVEQHELNPLDPWYAPLTLWTIKN